MNALLASFLNILALAGLALGAFGMLLVGASSDPGRDGGRALMCLMLSLPLAAGLLLSYGLGVARDGFGWVAPGSRGLQWLLVLAAALSAGLVLAGSAALRLEPQSQVPWALWPLRGWAFAVWAPLLVAGAALALWPAWRAGLPAWAWRLPLAALGGISLLATAGLLLQALQLGAERDAARIEQRLQDDAERDRWVMAEVERAEVERDLVGLMNQTSLFESPAFRARALAKVASHPDLNRALDEMLRGGWRDYALTYLESNDAPDNRALMPAVQQALLGLAEDWRDSMRRTHTLQPDAFDAQLRRALAVAEKFDALGGDHLAAMRALRAALDEPRPGYSPPVRLNAVATLDRWLQQRRARP